MSILLPAVFSAHLTTLEHATAKAAWPSVRQTHESRLDGSRHQITFHTLRQNDVLY